MRYGKARRLLTALLVSALAAGMCPSGALASRSRDSVGTSRNERSDATRTAPHSGVEASASKKLSGLGARRGFERGDGHAGRGVRFLSRGRGVSALLTEA